MFPSTREFSRLLSVVVVVSSIAPQFVFGQEDLRVLPMEGERGPTRDMLSRYLAQLVDEAFKGRRAAYEKIKTPEQAVEYQARMRTAFTEHLGGFPDRTPLNAKAVGTIEGDGYRIET